MQRVNISDGWDSYWRWSPLACVFISRGVAEYSRLRTHLAAVTRQFVAGNHRVRIVVLKLCWTIGQLRYVVVCYFF